VPGTVDLKANSIASGGTKNQLHSCPSAGRQRQDFLQGEFLQAIWALPEQLICPGQRHFDIGCGGQNHPSADLVILQERGILRVKVRIEDSALNRGRLPPDAEQGVRIRFMRRR
jgi:hypothetical protein